jgi:hypothetical protein
MIDDAFYFEAAQEEYAKLLVRMDDGSMLKGTVKTNKRLSDEVNDQEPFLVLNDATCRLEGAKACRREVIFVNKRHVLWAVPTS